jgi:hypothetical protein
MQEFIARFADQVQGTLSGFDRVLFRGSIRRLTHAQGMKMYLIRNGLLCKEFADHVKRVSADVKEAALEPFHKQGLPVRHIYDSHLDKDQIARTLAAELQILQGDVCALTAMEISPTFQHVNTGMEVRPRPTLVVYPYRIDPEFGWMHSRIQTWFPFYIHVCINGREWLGRRMDAAGMHYLRQDNCFPWMEDIARAQCLMDEQIHVDWNTRLQSFADRLNPLHQHIFRNFDAATYYGSAFQCEWATDVMLRPGALRRLEPLLLRHGLLNFSSPDILRFWGKRIRLDGCLPERFNAPITSSLKLRPQGERLKHWWDGNSLKGYGKAHTWLGDLFRIECMMAILRAFRNYRAAENGPADDLRWRTLRRGVVDLPERARLSQCANQRYLDAFATLDDTTRMAELIQPLQQPCQFGNRRVRGLQPFRSDDYLLLQTIQRGEFNLNGFRNRDLQRFLYDGGAPPPPHLDLKEKRRRSAAVGRKIRLLRAHGLIEKAPHSNLYHLTQTGRRAITAVLTIQQSSLSELNRLAA